MTFKSCHSTAVAKLIMPVAFAHCSWVPCAQGRASAQLPQHSPSQFYHCAAPCRIVRDSSLPRKNMNEIHHIQMGLPFLPQCFSLHSKLQENSCTVLNKGYISVPCRKTTQVLLNESRVCQQILFPILNVHVSNAISEIAEIFLYLHVHMHT